MRRLSWALRDWRLERGQVRIESERLVGIGTAVDLPPEVKHRSDRTFSHPYYWSGFMLTGSPW
jgi:CHAT domain-containing protein